MLGFLDGWTLGDSGNMIKTVARFFKWTPEQIGELYLDDFDYLGLVFWYQDCREQDEQAKKEVAQLKQKR